MKRTNCLSAFATLVVVLIGCRTSETEAQPGPDVAAQEAAHKPPPITEKLEPYECGNVTRLHTYKGVFLGSQPAPADFEQAKKGGIKTVINLRHHDEIEDFDEAKVVGGLGLAYHNVPWNGPEELADERFDEVRELLRTAERPILLHCSSANRVGPMWLVYRVLDEGASYEDALNEAKIVGMKSPDYEVKAKSYVERNRG